MPAKVAVVIPVYKAELNELEKISLAQCRKVLGNYQLIFVAPAGKKISYFAPTDGIAYFPPQFFQNVLTYNRLMTTTQFYATFKDFEYILIYQLDAFVFRNELEYFCSLGYDYIGAPWPYYARRNFPDKRNVRIGNGGFSLRRVQAHYNLLTKHSDLARRMMGIAEDDFFAYCGAREDIDFNVPPVEIASLFSVEYLPKHSLKNIGWKFPFGCHGWTKMSADFYVKALPKFGYDLSTLRGKMNDLDQSFVVNDLVIYAFQRLNRRLEQGKSIMRYLPRKKFASVRVVRRPLNILILARLLLENPTITNSVHLYEYAEQDLLLNDLTPEEQPHLLIDKLQGGGGYDKEFISAAELKGLVYGTQILSFHREYLTCCQELFLKFGK